ncbi:MAG: hypothetical protein ACI9CA_001299 [Natronomonas sp.]|jgi:hypothetical protein
MDEQLDQQASGADASGPDATFATVADLLDSWSPHAGRNTPAARDLRWYLNEELNDGDTSVWNRDIVERRRGSSSADVVVNGEIGVKLVERTGSADPGDLTVVIRLLSNQYNYLVIYWLDTSPVEADYRRNVERTLSAAQLGIKDLRFVTAPSDASGLNPPAQSAVGGSGLRRPLFAGVLSVLGAGAAGVLVTHLSELSQLFVFGIAGVIALSAVLIVISANSFIEGAE